MLFAYKEKGRGYISENIFRDVKEIENITRWSEDMTFIFEWWKQYFTNESSKWVKYCF
jgi:hypothetical protein